MRRTTPGGTLYLAADHLGSTRLVLDANGNCVNRSDFLPFGHELWRTDPCYLGNPAGAGPVTQRFTGQERDAETKLDFFGARYYSAGQGRFTSPDAPFADQSPADPLSWNLYSYVRNNPMILVDPSGEECVYVGPKDGDSADPTNYADKGSSGQSCKDAFGSKPHRVSVYDGKDAVSSTVSDALGAFLFGGQKQLDYGPEDPFTQDFQKSIGMDAILAGVKKNCKALSGRVAVRTREAFYNALIDGIFGGDGFYTPNAQLGAFVANYQRQDGRLSVLVENSISLNSLTFHLSEDWFGFKNPTSGAFGTVDQRIGIRAADPCKVR